MESRKATSLKAICYTAYHVTVATLIFSYVIYLITGEWEYEYMEEVGLGLVAYIVWEFIGYYIFERMWNSRFANKIRNMKLFRRIK